MKDLGRRGGYEVCNAVVVIVDILMIVKRPESIVGREVGGVGGVSFVLARPDSSEVATASGGVEAVRSAASEWKFFLPIYTVS